MNADVPVRIDDAPSIDVAVATRHTCIVRSDGTVGCRGTPLEGQFAEESSSTFGFVTIGGIQPVVAIRAHDKATCALSETGAVFCWGGLVGFDPGRIYRRSPVRIDVDATSVNVGRGDAIGLGEECAASRSGSVLCWQRSFLDGPIGVPDPRPVPGISDANAVTMGNGFACALSRGGGINCWGRNFAGHLGDGTFEDAERPTNVVGISSAVDVTAGGSHVCAALAGGQLVCWGRNDRGQLGIEGDLENSSTPITLTLP